MTALEKMRDAFESCTVMAGVEPDFECIYITKAAANMLFNEAEAENEKLRELARELWDGYMDPPCEDCPLKDKPVCADCPICAREAAVVDRMRELGIEVD